MFRIQKYETRTNMNDESEIRVTVHNRLPPSRRNHLSHLAPPRRDIHEQMFSGNGALSVHHPVRISFQRQSLLPLRMQHSPNNVYDNPDIETLVELGRMYMQRGVNYRYNENRRDAHDPELFHLLSVSFEEQDPFQRDETITIAITKLRCSQTNSTRNCAVCREELVFNEEIGRIACGHTFHTHCIEEWGRYKQECPLCRAPIPLAPPLRHLQNSL